MTGSGEGQQPAARVVRAREGRLVGGVCAGLPRRRGIGTNGMRLLFVIWGLIGGIGVVAYLACWLVIPADDQDPDADAVRTVVLLAWATGGLVALVLVAAAAAAATVFGLGWVVFGLAAGVAALTFSPLRTRIPTVAALLALGALTLPAIAVALSPLRLTLSGTASASPKSFGAVDQTTYRSGFSTMLIDLRHTAPMPPGSRATLHIDAGLRRTIVALPSGRCVRVRVNYDIHLFPAHLAALLTGRFLTPFHDVVLFGQPYGYGARLGTTGTAMSQAGRAGPLLTIDFTSQGGGLYVRNYPDTVDPQLTPQWPGYRVAPEPRPYLGNEPSRLRKQILRGWRRRVAVDRAEQRRIETDMPGPCGA